MKKARDAEHQGDALLDAAVHQLLSDMTLLQPELPKQRNCSDCGVFALQYAEEMMARWPECRGQVEGFADDMFTLQTIKVPPPTIPSTPR